MAPKIISDILTGFLGSGKTTLLNALLASGGFTDTAVVVNELGEIGLDHLLVAERTDQIALLEGGCLCCEVADSLPETLLELCRKRAAGEVPPFKRIVIETTGLADPAPIADVIRRSPLLAHFLQLGVVVTAVDTLSGADQLQRFPEAMAQLVMADRLVLTKLDLREPLSDLEEANISVVNPLAPIVTAQQVLENPALLVAPVGEISGQCNPSVTESVDDPVHAHHSHGIRAYNFPIPEAVTRSGLAAWSAVLVHKLGPSLLRCKGVVDTARNRLLVQGVGGRFLFEGAPAALAGMPASLTCIVQNRTAEEIARTLHWLHVSEGTQPPMPEDM